MRPSEKVWNAYKMYLGSQFTTRKGFNYFGMTQASDIMPDGKDKSETLLFFERGDSDLEHQAKVAMLTGLIYANYPGFFESVELILPTNEHDRIVFFLLMTALCHDVGEGIKLDGKKLGDIIDNETKKHESKYEEEFKRFSSFVNAGFDAFVSSYFRMLFRDMSTRELGVCWCLYGPDKLEPILLMAFLEKMGMAGHYRSSKKDGASDNDLRCIEITGTDNALDCISAHLRMQLKHAPLSVTEPIYEILREAVTDARGEFFSWWDKEVPEFWT